MLDVEELCVLDGRYMYVLIRVDTQEGEAPIKL